MIILKKKGWDKPNPLTGRELSDFIKTTADLQD